MSVGRGSTIFARRAVLVTGALVACASQSPRRAERIPLTVNAATPSPGARPGTGTGPGELGWLISESAMEMLRAQGDAALVDGYFANARTYVIAGPKQYDRIPPQALLARSFTTLDGVEADCAEQGTRHVEGLAEALNRGIDARVRAILYDNEHWCLTPIEEQRRHGEYEGKVASAVHAHSLLLIAAPATDLVRTFEPDFAGSVYPEFLRLGILADAARTADRS